MEAFRSLMGPSFRDTSRELPITENFRYQREDQPETTSSIVVYENYDPDTMGTLDEEALDYLDELNEYSTKMKSGVWQSCPNLLLVLPLALCHLILRWTSQIRGHHC